MTKITSFTIEKRIKVVCIIIVRNPFVFLTVRIIYLSQKKNGIIYATIVVNKNIRKGCYYSSVTIKSSPSSFMPFVISNFFTTPARGDCTTISIFIADKTING